MTTPKPSHKSLIAFERNPTNDVVAQTSSKIDASVLTGFGGVRSASISTDGGSTSISELSEAGVRRLLGRSDATLDLEFNLDATVAQHQNLITDARDETPYTVAIDFDNTLSPSDRFGMAFVAKVASVDVSSDDDQADMTVSFSVANGNDFLAKTMTNGVSETATTPYAAFKTSIQITGDPIATTGESTSNVSGNIYEIDDSSKDIWDPTANVKVYESSVQTTSGYTEEYLNGRVVFDSAPTEPVTVDVSYLPKYTVTEAHTVSFSADGKLNDTPRLGDRAIRRTQSHYDFTSEFDQYDLGDETIDSGGTEDQFIEIVESGRLVVLSYELDTTQTNTPKVRSIGRFNALDEDLSQDDIISANFSFEASQFNVNSNNLAQHELYRFKQ